VAQGAEEGWIEVGYGRELVIEDRRAVWEGTVSLAERASVLAAKDGGTVNLAGRTSVLAAENECTVRRVKLTKVLTAGGVGA
jgi:hypothetical protein